MKKKHYEEEIKVLNETINRLRRENSKLKAEVFDLGIEKLKLSQSMVEGCMYEITPKTITKYRDVDALLIAGISMANILLLCIVLFQC